MAPGVFPTRAVAMPDGRTMRTGSGRAPGTLETMAFAVLAAFWVAVGLFLLLAPDHVFKSGRRNTRRYGALGCLFFAGSA